MSKVTAPFEILVDCTKFSSANQIPAIWISRLIELTLPATDKLLSRVTFFSPNTAFKRYLRRLNRTFSFDKFDSRRAEVIASPTDLEQSHRNLEAFLPASHVVLHKEKRTTFTHINQRNEVAVEHPVLFKLGLRTLVVSTGKQQDLFADLKSRIEDVIEFEEVEELRKVQFGTEGVGLAIKLRGEREAKKFLVADQARRDELFSVSCFCKPEMSLLLLTRSSFVCRRSFSHGTRPPPGWPATGIARSALRRPSR